MKLAYLALPAISFVMMLAGCGSAAPKPTSLTSGPGAAVPAAQAPPPSPMLTCTTLVETGTDLTANQVIYALWAGVAAFVDDPEMQIADSGNTVVGFAQDAAIDLGGYAGNQLSTDAAQFSQDATAYAVAVGAGDMTPAEASAVDHDIVALVADCPDSVNAGSSS
jgi:hypothetical protein